MIAVDFAIEHPLAFLSICGALMAMGWSAHKTRRLTEQLPQHGVVIEFPSRSGDAA